MVADGQKMVDVTERGGMGESPKMVDATERGGMGESPKTVDGTERGAKHGDTNPGRKVHMQPLG